MTDEDSEIAESDEVPITVEESGEDDGEQSARNRLGKGAERAIDGFDRSIVELLAWLLETETRSRIYIFLRKSPDSTSEEIAEGTGLYPSTVREALAALFEEGRVTRRKRENEGAGNNPFEYRAIPPSELVGGMVGSLQDQLNAVVNLDEHLRGEKPRSDTDPITITVDEEDTDDRGDSENR